MRSFKGTFCVLLALAVSQALAGCGGAPAAAPLPPSGAALTGNWNVVGTGSLLSFPALSFSLIAVGDQLYAEGSAQFQCSGDSGGGGGSISLTGQIAPDGSFQLTMPKGLLLSINGSPIQIVVNGTVPTSTSANWGGTYSIRSTGGNPGCTVNETGPFNAVPYAPMDASYAGKLSTNTSVGSVSVSIAATQGAPAPGQMSSGIVPPYYLPLNATVTISGVPCFTQGTTTSISKIAGSSVSMIFLMNDGSEMLFTGKFDSTQETSMQVTLASAAGGQCSGTGYFGTLTRQ